MALDFERPNAAVPSSRSSSPQEQRSPQQHHHHSGPPVLKFSIEKILSPDFGRKDAAEKRDKDELGTKVKSPEPRSAYQVNNTSLIWPHPTFSWLRCSRTSARPSSGPRRIRCKARKGSSSKDLSDDDQSPRYRRIKRKEKKPDDKRPRTAFTADQLARLKQEFQENRYLNETRRRDLSKELHLNESQVKIWFQNRRAKQKKALGKKCELTLQLMADGLYNHSTIPIRDEEDDERPKSSSSS